jgi:hypothetical protein
LKEDSEKNLKILESDKAKFEKQVGEFKAQVDFDRNNLKNL